MCILLLSCSKEDVVEPNMYADISELLEFEPLSSSQYVAVSTNQNEWSAYSDQDWCNIRKDLQGFYIDVDDYGKTISRSANIIVETNQLDPIEFVIIQKASYISFEPTEDQYFTDEGGVFDITITSNYHWELTASHDWISCDVLNGTGDAKVTVSIDSSTSVSYGEATISIESGDIVETIDIYRDGIGDIYSVGDVYPKTGEPIGVVFETNELGNHGKIVSMFDVLNMYCAKYESNGTWYLQGYSGLESVKTIRELSSGDLSFYRAMLYWDDYQSIVDYDERWYLPSTSELWALYDVWYDDKDTLDDKLKEIGGDPISSSGYMSCNEFSSTEYLYVEFGSSGRSVEMFNKGSIAATRGVKQF